MKWMMIALTVVRWWIGLMILDTAVDWLAKETKTDIDLADCMLYAALLVAAWLVGRVFAAIFFGIPLP